MRSNTRRDTAPELAVRKLLHARGLRYRVDVAPLPASPRKRADIVFTRLRIAVFIDGCFWHGCPEHATLPVRNKDYWGPKLQRNKQRDQDTNVELEQHGWQVIRVWEHEVPAAASDRIVAAVAARRRTEVERSSANRKNPNSV